MNNIVLSREESMLLDITRKVCEKYIQPMIKKMDDEEYFPDELFQILAKTGVFSLLTPMEFGGNGGKMRTLILIIEEIAGFDPAVAAIVCADYLGILALCRYGTPEQQKRYLPVLARGEILSAFCVTEPQAGSAIDEIQTVAVRHDDAYLINGTKQFITNAEKAGVFIAAVKTSPEKGARGISLVIIDRETAGLEIGKKEKKMGIRASATNEVVFNNCKVRSANILGEKENRGFQQIARLFSESRLTVGALSTGLALGAYELALDYSRERKQSGKKISEFQGIRWMLAVMAVKISAARALLYSVSGLAEQCSESINNSAAQVKLFTSNVAVEVASDALQIFGGYGYIRDYPIEKYYRDARILKIFEGTDQVMKNIIASEELKKSKRRKYKG